MNSNAQNVFRSNIPSDIPTSFGINQAERKPRKAGEQHVFSRHQILVVTAHGAGLKSAAGSRACLYAFSAFLRIIKQIARVMHAVRNALSIAPCDERKSWEHATPPRAAEPSRAADHALRSKPRNTDERPCLCRSTGRSLRPLVKSRTLARLLTRRQSYHRRTPRTPVPKQPVS